MNVSAHIKSFMSLSHNSELKHVHPSCQTFEHVLYFFMCGFKKETKINDLIILIYLFFFSPICFLIIVPVLNVCQQLLASPSNDISTFLVKKKKWENLLSFKVMDKRKRVHKNMNLKTTTDYLYQPNCF